MLHLGFFFQCQILLCSDEFQATTLVHVQVNCMLTKSRNNYMPRFIDDKRAPEMLSTLLSLRLSLKLLLVSAVVQALGQNLETGAWGKILFYFIFCII